MKNLIPEIIIGKEYLLHEVTFEYECPYCGYISIGSGKVTNIIVIRPAIYGNCQGCDKIIYLPDGWYDVQYSDGQHFAVPYTILEAIKE